MTTDTSVPVGPAETMPFGELEIAFDDRVLRPRPWTAEQAAWGAELLRTAPGGPVLELCSGAGQIGLLTVAGAPRRLVCVDLDPVACDFARRNAAAAGLAQRVEVRQARLEEGVHPDERFALVVADPPWVRRSETGHFPEDPVLAIDGGDDGLDVAWSCLTVAGRHLVPGGSVVLQIGTVEQVDRIREGLANDLELVVTETRTCERGVLVRLDRMSTSSGT